MQSEPTYVPPVWPTTPGEQQMMMHLDIAAENLEKAVAWARMREQFWPTTSRRTTSG